MKRRFVTNAVLMLALSITGCATNGQWFLRSSRLAELAGTWIDVEKTTPTDTAAWLLGAGGDDHTLHLRVRRDSSGGIQIDREQRRYGYWYLKGELSDTLHRAICFKERPRDGGTCRQFRLDTLPGAPPRRRLTILGYPGEHHVSARVLTERLPK